MIRKAKHTFIEPRELRGLIESVLDQAGLEGEFQIIMGAMIKATSHTKGVSTYRLMPYGIEVKAQPGDNKTRRICTIYAKADIPPQELLTRVERACDQMFGKESFKDEIVEEESEESETVSANEVKLDSAPSDTESSEHRSELTTSTTVLQIKPEKYEEREPTTFALETLPDQEDRSWRYRIDQMHKDESLVANVLSDIEEKMEQEFGRVPSRVIGDIYRDRLGLRKDVPAWVVPSITRKFVEASYLQGFTKEDNDRPSQYVPTETALELIARTQGHVPQRLTQMRQTSATVEHSSIVQPQTPNDLLSLVLNTKRAVVAYHAASIEIAAIDKEVSGLDSAIAPLQTQLEQIGQEIVRLQSQKTALIMKRKSSDAIVNNPTSIKAAKEWDELKKLTKDE